MERVLVFENGKGQNTYKIKRHIKKVGLTLKHKK